MERSGVLRGLRPVLIDAVGPIAAYFGLRALGVADLPALLAGAGVAAADAMVSLAIQRRLRPLPVVVCAIFALTGALAYATHDPRMLLLKPSIVSAGLGAYLLGIAAHGPSLAAALAPVIARGSADRAQRWREAWAQAPPLRRCMRLACAVSGALLVAEAASRAVIVFRFAVAQSLFLAHAPGAIVIVALVLIVRFWVQPAVARVMAGPAGATR